MLVDKSYQDSPSLQAIYDAKNSVSKLFSGIESRCTPGKFEWINRAPLAKDAGVGERQTNRLILDLENKGVIERQLHSTKVAHASAYRITEFGYQVLHIFQQINKINKYVALTTCLLLSPVKINVPRVKLDVFNKGVVSLLSERELQTAPARDPKNTQILQTTARKEVDVGSMEHKTMDLPEHVVDLTPLLQLTTHGQLKLSIFDKETVDYCWAAIKQASGCKDVFKELANLCVQYCEDNGKRPDWGFYYEQMKTGIAEKNDKYTARPITSGMIKPRVVKESNPFAESKSYTDYKNRDKSQEPERWIDRQVRENAERHKARAAEYLAFFEDLRGERAPEEVRSVLKIEEVEVVEVVPTEWSQTDKQLVDWALGYIDTMTLTKHAYAPFVQEILLGPNSPRARSGELQAGLKLMQRLYFKEMASRLEQTPITKVVTELKDQIVCAQIANDEKVWDNLTYSPVEGDERYEEIYD